MSMTGRHPPASSDDLLYVVSVCDKYLYYKRLTFTFDNFILYIYLKLFTEFIMRYGKNHLCNVFIDYIWK